MTKNKLSKKQTFRDLYEDNIKQIAVVLGIIFIFMFPVGITAITKDFKWLFIYLAYGFAHMIRHISIVIIRYNRLTRLSLTNEEKELLHITSAEDCLVFLNLYTRFKNENFSLLNNEKFINSILDFIRSSMTEEEITLEKSYQSKSKWVHLLYDREILPSGGLFFDIMAYKYYGTYYGGEELWIITPFCKENFDRAIKENWTWEKYVEEREKYTQNQEETKEE